MKLGRSLSLVFVSSLVLSGCTSIAPPQMTYLGDASQKMEVVGKSTHIDFAGLGVTPEKYAQEYNEAVTDAFQRAPTGTTVLKNIKIIKVPNPYPTWVAMGLMASGSALLSSSSMYYSRGDNGTGGQMVLGGAFLLLNGLGFSAVTSYDTLVYAEPSSE
jgi:hypothetical protein